MGSQNWGSKWNYIKGIEHPATTGQRFRGWLVNKFGSSVFSGEHGCDLAWKEGYKRDGGRAADLDKRMRSNLINHLSYPVFKSRLDTIARDNVQARREAEDQKAIARGSVIPDRKEPITSRSAGYEVKPETRCLSIPEGLIDDLMNDPQFNPFANDPDIANIKIWAANLKNPEHMDADLKRTIQDVKLYPEQSPPLLVARYQKANQLLLYTLAIYLL